MARAVLADAVLAESDRVRVVEDIVYFPSEDVDRRYLIESDTRSWCYWKGRASYYHVRAGDLFLPYGRVVPSGSLAPRPLAARVCGLLVGYRDSARNVVVVPEIDPSAPALVGERRERWGNQLGARS